MKLSRTTKIVLFVLFFGGISILYFAYEKNNQVPAGSIAIPTLRTARLSDEFYTNTRFGYRIKLPIGWQISKQLSIWMEATRNVAEKDEADPEPSELLDAVRNLQGKRVIEISNLEKVWNQDNAEILVLVPISITPVEAIEKEYMIQIIVDKLRIDVKRVEDKDLGFFSIQRITTNKGDLGLYSLYKDQTPENRVFSAELKHSSILGTGDLSGIIEIESKAISQEDFLNLARSLEFF